MRRPAFFADSGALASSVVLTYRSTFRATF